MKKEFSNETTQKVVVNKTFSDPLPVSVELHKVWVTAQLLFKCILMILFQKLMLPQI